MKNNGIINGDINNTGDIVNSGNGIINGDVFISVYEVRRPRKRRTQIMVDGESGKHYLYEYSCETNEWQMIKKE